jgi:hypothetical protein
VVGPALARAATETDTAANPLAKISVINSVLVGSSDPASQQALSVSVLQNNLVSSKLLGVGVGADHQLLIVSAGGKQVFTTSSLTSGALTGGLPLSGLPLSSLPLNSLPLSSLPLSSLPVSSLPLSSLTAVTGNLPVLSTVTGALTGVTGTAGASSPLSGVTSLLGSLGKIGH